MIQILEVRVDFTEATSFCSYRVMRRPDDGWASSLRLSPGVSPLSVCCHSYLSGIASHCKRRSATVVRRDNVLQDCSEMT